MTWVEEMASMTEQQVYEAEQFVRRQVRDYLSIEIELQYRRDLIARRNAEQRANRFLICAKHRSGDTPGRNLKIAVAKREFEKRHRERRFLSYCCMVESERMERLRESR